MGQVWPVVDYDYDPQKPTVTHIASYSIYYTIHTIINLYI